MYTIEISCNQECHFNHFYHFLLQACAATQYWHFKVKNCPNCLNCQLHVLRIIQTKNKCWTVLDWALGGHLLFLRVIYISWKSSTFHESHPCLLKVIPICWKSSTFHESHPIFLEVIHFSWELSPFVESHLHLPIHANFLKVFSILKTHCFLEQSIHSFFF